MSRLLVVLGATGIQGGSIVETYLNKPEWKIRAIIRDQSKPAVKKLEEQGAEVVAADLNDVESLTAAFSGANMVFAVTDFWAPFFLPTTTSKLGPSQTINEYCYALELQQGKNIALAASRSLSSLDLLIWSSLVDSKNGVRRSILRSLARPASCSWAVICLISRTRHWRRGAPLIEQLMLSMPHSSTIPEPYVDPVHDTGRFVEALETLGGGQKLYGVSDMRTCGEYMKLWGEVIRERVKIEEVSIEEYIQEISKRHEGLAKEVAASRGFNADFGWIGGEENVLMPKDLGIKTTTIEEFIQRTDWSPMMRNLKESL